MGTFVTGNTALPAQKTDAYPPTGLATELDAADINNLWSAAGDLRTGMPFISVKAYGAAGDGSDATSAVQSAVTAATTGSVLFVPAGSYVFSGAGVTVSKALTILMAPGAAISSAGTAVFTVTASDVTILGGTITLLTNATTAQQAITPLGTVDNLTVDGVTISGQATMPDGAHGGQTAFGNNSGQTLTQIRILNCDVSSVNVGISLNADTGGSITNALVQGNRIYNIIGSGTTSTGYGIHHANGSGSATMARIIGNYIDHAQRHSIYIAKGSGVLVMGNHITNHRATLQAGDFNGQFRAAIVVARSSDVAVTGNVLINNFDCSINVTGGTSSANGTQSVLVGDNVLVDPLGGVPAIRIGSDDPTADLDTQHVSVVHNTIRISAAVTSAIDGIRVSDGLWIVVRGNDINTAVATQAITVEAITDDVSTNLHTNYIRIEKNRIQSTHTIGIRLATTFCTSTAIASFVDNMIIGPTFPILNSVTLTNPNVTIDKMKAVSAGLTLGAGVFIRGLPDYSGAVDSWGTAAPVAGAWNRGDRMWNTTPVAAGVPGWICVTAGTPGTWKAMAALAA